MAQNAADLVAASWNGTRVVGHRGAAAYRPENTIEAFREGIASGADAIECDVHVSRDGELVVIHDHTLDRTTALSGPVADADSSAMHAVGVPSLDDYLEAIDGRAIAIIELKGGHGVVSKTIDRLNRRNMVDRTILFSFYPQFLAEAAEQEPGLYSVWLVAYPMDVETISWIRRKAGAKAIGVDRSIATGTLIRAMHEDGVPVFVWTVPPGPEVDRLKEERANFIISNHPRDVRAQLAK